MPQRRPHQHEARLSRDKRSRNGGDASLPGAQPTGATTGEHESCAPSHDARGAAHYLAVSGPAIGRITDLPDVGPGTPGVGITPRHLARRSSKEVMTNFPKHLILCSLLIATHLARNAPDQCHHPILLTISDTFLRVPPGSGAWGSRIADTTAQSQPFVVLSREEA